MLADKDVKSFFAATRAESGDDVKTKLASLQQLVPVSGEKAYVLGIFRADMELTLGNRDAAAGLFLAALQKNPFLTGVWKDLGDNFATAADAADAWRCYDIARRIAPQHPLLKDVAAREDAVAKTHPELF